MVRRLPRQEPRYRAGPGPVAPRLLPLPHLRAWDGAPWIWNLATAILPEATPIVDLYHARQHVHDLAGQLAPALGEHHSDWLTARLVDLDSGDIETLVNNRSGSTPVTRNEVCMKPGVVQGSAALVRAVRVSALPRDEIEAPGALCTTFWRCW